MYASIVLKSKTSSHGGKWPRVQTLDGRRVAGTRDYSNTSKSGHGTVIYYALPPGAYQIREIISWKHDRDYFIVVHDSGEIEEINEQQAKEISRNQCS